MVELRVTLASLNQRVSLAPTGPKHLCMFAQAKAWAEFSWPFGPSASPSGNPEHLGDSCDPKGHASIAQAKAWALEFSWPYGP